MWLLTPSGLAKTKEILYMIYTRLSRVLHAATIGGSLVLAECRDEQRAFHHRSHNVTD
jgi:hypothetical protein